MVYRIAKWESVFERAESRKLKQLTWIAMPVGFNSSGYQSMLDTFGDEAPAIYGAWCALCGVAASCAVRGLLGTSRGNPLKISHITRMTGFPSAVLEKLVAWASSPEIGWLEEIDEHNTREILRENGISGESPDDPPTIPRLPDPTQPDQTRHNPTSPNPTRPDRTGGDGRSVGGGCDLDLDEVVRNANKLVRKLGDVDRELLWEVAWFGEAFEPGLVSDVLSAIAAKSVRQPTKYLKACIRRVCEERGIDRNSIEVPPPPRMKEVVT